jgi:hypothetical protein
MHSDGYRRLRAACLTMACQSDLSDVQVRWLNVAEASLKLANDADDMQLHARLARPDRRPTFPRHTPAWSGPRAA